MLTGRMISSQWRITSISASSNRLRVSCGVSQFCGRLGLAAPVFSASQSAVLPDAAVIVDQDAGGGIGEPPYLTQQSLDVKYIVQ